MKNTNTISSHGKINIHIGVIKKQNPNFHKIETLVTYVDLCDKIYIKEINNKKNKIIFYGNYAKRIGAKNTISKVMPAKRYLSLGKPPPYSRWMSRVLFCCTPTRIDS